MNKKDARAYSLRNRTLKDKSLLEKSLVDKIIQSKVLEKYKHIGIYYPIGDEMSVLSLLSLYPDKKFYLPITNKEIAFVLYKEGDTLYDGPFHTKEPKGIIIPRCQIECFIIPCVAVSKDLKRLGYGKGYYDRYLEDYSGLKIGIVYEDSILDIDMDYHDLKLDIIFTG